MRNGKIGRTPACFLVMMAAWAWVPSAPADVIAVEGRPMAVGVTVLDLKEGNLFYRLPSGREVNRPIEQVKYMQMTGWDEFNAAEKLRQSGQWRDAVAAYEQVLASVPGMTGRLDRGLLVCCRLVGAFDEEGMFDRAVAMYLGVVERMPAVATTLRPKRIPAAGSTFLATAAAAVDAFLSTRRGTPVGAAVAEWRFSWPDVAGRVKPESSPENAAVMKVKSELTEAERLIAAGRFDDALNLLESFQNPQAGAGRPEVYYWQGRALLGRSERPGSADAERDGRRAGLAFMRVAIHYPVHPLAAESLFRAGELCRRAGQSDLAANLWLELVQQYPADRVWHERARREMSRPSTRPVAGSPERK